ncbi:MAG: M14 family zinc carboxypeptidase, partial [Bacteroidales bacterium]|nr:M14 family zinc carboxypeptidase [Bacteroidales bacterium]
MKNFTLCLLLVLFTTFSFSQSLSPEMDFALEKLSERGEFYFTFNCSNHELLRELTEIISIDNYKSGLVYAYANSQEFNEFLNYNLDFTPVYSYYDASKALTMATTVAQMANWDRYPTHAVYEEMMQDFVDNYPALAKLETIGTSIDGWPILCLIISDNINDDEDEPEFWWSSSMHGDETTGIILSLRYADYLLSNYGSISQVTNLVDNVEIYINPMSNPDGTFYGSATGTSISTARRYNANGVDLNRNFPRMEGGSVNNQQEIQIMMDYASAHDFVMSVNFHGGAEVANFPWDTYESSDNTHADDTWWDYVAHIYADYVISISGGASFTDTYPDGVTEGGDWYVITGSRQDYMNYFQGIREITMEVSTDKDLEVAYLNTYWNYNRQAMLDYTEQVLYGLRGIVTDACTGTPLADVKVEIVGHDEDNSHVYTAAPVGNYHRPIYAGTYDFTFSLAGYQSQTHTVTITNDVSTRLDIQLIPDGIASPDFSASSVNVIIGSDVNFTDLTSGTVTSMGWVFEGGNPATSGDQNPTVNYATDGVFDVSLEVVSAGCTVTELKEDYITVYIPGAPVAGFTSDVTTTCTGIVQFTNTSVDADTYEWDFGDGNTSTEENPLHTYTESGILTVSLTAYNAYGDNTYSVTDMITVNLPEAPTTTGDESCGAASLTLTASGSGTLAWYDAATLGNFVQTGTSLTDNFTNTTTYYVQSGVSPEYFSGGNSDIDVNGGNHTSNNYYLIFSATEDFRLVSVQVNSETEGNRIIQLRNSSSAEIDSKTVYLYEGINTVSLDFDIPAGTDYQLKCGTTTSNLWRNNTGTSWPYDIGEVVSITGTNAGDANYYYYFYNWQIMIGDECVSARTPVTATINSIPDVDAPADVTACDSYTLPALTNGEYFLSSGGINPVSAGYEITTTTTVYVYAETGTIPNCTNENSFTVTINETPVVDNLPDVEVCDLYTIPVLTNGQCYNNLGTLLPSGTIITESQVITIYAETGTTPNCFAESSFDVTINSAAQVDIGDNLTSECGGTVTLDAGIGYTSYSWNSVAGDQTYEATSTGTYTVVVEDANGCTSTDDVSVTILDSPTVSVITTPESAPGANDGTATANVSEGTAPYSLTWQSPYSGNPLTGLSGGFYCVTV